MPSALPRSSTGLLAATAVISTALAGIPTSAQSKGPSIGITKIYFG